MLPLTQLIHLVVLSSIPHKLNNKFIIDAAKFGHTYLAKHGWTPSTGLGVAGDGRVSHIAVAQKLDQLGIGAGRPDGPDAIAWKQAKEFEGLLERLNAAGAGGGDETVTVVEEIAETVEEEVVDEKEEKARRKEKKREEKRKAKAALEESGTSGSSTEETAAVVAAPAPRRLAYVHPIHFIHTYHHHSHLLTNLKYIQFRPFISVDTAPASSPPNVWLAHPPQPSPRF